MEIDKDLVELAPEIKDFTWEQLRLYVTSKNFIPFIDYQKDYGYSAYVYHEDNCYMYDSYCDWNGDDGEECIFQNYEDARKRAYEFILKRINSPYGVLSLEFNAWLAKYSKKGKYDLKLEGDLLTLNIEDSFGLVTSITINKTNPNLEYII